MPELFEKLERKKRLKIKCDKKIKHSNNRERKESRDEEARAKYKKQYLEHMQNLDEESEDMCM